MGVSSSVPLAKPFSDIRAWSKEKYDETIDIFQDEEYGYIMETNDVVDLIQCTNDEAIDIVKCICFCPGIVCANVFMVSIIALADTAHLDEKLPHIFDLMDDKRNGLLSQDELIILLMCIGEAFLFILNLDRNERETVNEAAIEFGKNMYTSMGKNYTQFVSKDEFVRWVKTNMFEKGMVTVDSIFRIVVPASETKSAAMEV